MSPRKRLFLLVIPIMVLLAAGCQEPVEQAVKTPEQGELSVYVVNYPLQYFAERIGGDRVSVHFPAPGDVYPGSWRPEEEIILRYQEADLILLNGADYARWTGHVSLPAATRVNTSQNIADRLLEVPDAVTHSHGPEGTHTHAGTAPIVWLDPMLAIEQARVVKLALAERRSDHADVFEERFESLVDDLRELDGRLRGIVSRDTDRALLASRPVYHYLEDRYGLNLETLHWEANRMPEAPEWEDLDELLEEHPAEWILWDEEPLAEIGDGLAERGIASIVYTPCEQPPNAGDFLSAMRRNVADLETAFPDAASQ